MLGIKLLRIKQQGINEKVQDLNPPNPGFQPFAIRQLIQTARGRCFAYP
jgi:hypothetical protein